MGKLGKGGSKLARHVRWCVMQLPLLSAACMVPTRAFLASWVAGEDYEALARDMNDRVYWAGEATIAKWPATMHGA